MAADTGAGEKAIALGITGASGAQYGLSLCQRLLQSGIPVYLMVSRAAQMVMALETDWNLPGRPEPLGDHLCEAWGVPRNRLSVFGREEWTAPVASGSGHWRALVVCPCSTGTLSAVATGASNNLIERCADVALKERRPAVLVVRESPYSRVHLQNMLAATDAGAVILPASPGFYHHPETVQDQVDFIVARILNVLDIPQDLLPAWGKS